jgi:protocatechuate 3,4-dioxygenase beta subunit
VQLPATAPPPGAQDVAPEPIATLATFRGRVIDAATHAPIREFAWRFAESGRTPGPKQFQTDDGRFEWQRLPPGRWSLIAKAPGYQPFFLPALELAGGRATSEIVVPLTRGNAVRGRIYDEVSNVGIASASISFHESGRPRYDGNYLLRPAVRSQSDGTFVLDGIPYGRMTLEVGASNYAGRKVDVVVDDDLAPLEIGLSAGASISGRLTASDGVTSVSGSVGLTRIGGASFGRNVPTNDAGEFSFRDLVPGNYRLIGRGPVGSAMREFVISASEQIEGVTLALHGGRTIRGTITGLRPGDLQQLRVSLRPEGGVGSGAAATINERGEYEVRNVQPGRARLAADVNNRRQLTRTIDMPANRDLTVDFDFPQGARISGRVTERGRPVARVWLEPRPVQESEDVSLYGAATSQTGYYLIQDVPPGEYTIWIQGSKSRVFQVSGDTVFDIDASPQLAGRILEDNGQVPIGDAQLELWPADAKSSQVGAFDQSDHFGRFSMSGLESRDFMLTVYKPGYAMFRERLAYTAPILDMTIRLRRDAGIEVHAHDAMTGKPLRKVLAMEMVGDHPTIKVQIPLDEQGTGYVPAALAGTTLAFAADGYAVEVLRLWNGEDLELKFSR